MKLIKIVDKMATYKQIQEYIKKTHGVSVKTCWIAHAKEICGIPTRKANNRKNVNKRIYPCPDDKLPIIKTAFKNFGMI